MSATVEKSSRFSFNASRLPPELIIVVGCIIAILTFGPRSAVGIFQLPLINERGWSTGVFSFAMALQYLFWGVGQPFSGAMADKYGTAPVMVVGLLLYALGLACMSWTTDPVSFTLTAGVMMGFGLSACSFNLVIGALAKLVPEHMRSIAFGAGTAAGSFGQFLFAPTTGYLVQLHGWHATIIAYAILMIFVVIFVPFVATAPNAASTKAAPQQSFGAAMKQAFRHKSYLLLVAGFYTCGFQLGFVTVHFQKYVEESGIEPHVGYWAFALVGIFNIVGSLYSGWLVTKIPKAWVLSGIYLGRSAVTVLFIMLPPTAWSCYLFGALSGLLWLSTVPPTSSLIGIMFGTRYFSTLYGFAFLSHQIGGFMGLVLSGWLRDATGSYLAMWWLSIAFGVFSGLVNLPIVEKHVDEVNKTAPAPA